MPNPQCTCPSGDGSLRWPCPAHPPADRAQLVAAKLRAMATNYPAGHLWDKLDAKACLEGALLLDGTHPKLASTDPWPEYVAGMVVGYLGGGVDDPRIKPIAGIISRRLWLAKTPNWVPVSERLPAIGEPVWIAAWAWNNPEGTRIYGVAIYDGKAWGNPQDPEQSATWWPPTHWMSLASPDA